MQLMTSGPGKLMCYESILQLMITTGNRWAWARIPAESKASLFSQKDFKFFKI